jgi:hypothetical protein
MIPLADAKAMDELAMNAAYITGIHDCAFSIYKATLLSCIFISIGEPLYNYVIHRPR